jgi:hypothetical protein
VQVTGDGHNHGSARSMGEPLYGRQLILLPYLFRDDVAAAFIYVVSV